MPGDPLLWTYGLLVAVGFAGGGLLLDRDLLRERRNPGPGGQDLLTVRVEQIMLTIHVPLALADRYFGWGPSWSWEVRVLGLGLLGLGAIGLLWSMRTNRFFSTVVRLQADRGHSVVTAGPYRLVRHPGYLATLLLFSGTGLALGSQLGSLPLIPLLPIVLRRTVLEDRFLQAHLAGYKAYAERVRSRLLPGIW